VNRTTTFFSIVTLLFAGASRADAQGVLDGDLTMHGYMTQGFARSDAAPMLGIPVGVTTDYRTVAVQTRYAIGDAGTAIVQFSHRRLGQSMLMQSEDALELDWAFYRHRAGPVVLQAGRFPLPRGIYNEIRDVGTLLPLFRAPFVLYEDGTETVDGVGVSTSADVGGWGIDAHAYAGGAEYKVPIYTPDAAFLLHDRVERNGGAQIWINTPLQGVRAGYSVMAWDDLTASGGLNSWIQLASFDATFEKWLFRAEHLRVKQNSDKVWAGYAHAQLELTDRLRAIAQYEIKDKETLGDFASPRLRVMEDASAGVSFAISPFAVLKLETHRATGFAFDRYVDPTGSPLRTWYSIASISASF
jgi:hypothetical protein